MIAKTFKGGRINLHVPGKEDYRFIHECLNEEEHRRMLTNNRPFRVNPAASIRQRLGQWLSRRLGVKNEGILFIAEAEGERVGVCGLQLIDYQDSKARIFVCVSNEMESLGYGYEINREVINFGFQELGLNKIKASHRVDNTDSQGLAEELGLERKCILEKESYVNGEYRDLVLYEVLREDWEES